MMYRSFIHSLTALGSVAVGASLGCVAYVTFSPVDTSRKDVVSQLRGPIPPTAASVDQEVKIPAVSGTQNKPPANALPTSAPVSPYESSRPRIATGKPGAQNSQIRVSPSQTAPRSNPVNGTIKHPQPRDDEETNDKANDDESTESADDNEDSD